MTPTDAVALLVVFVLAFAVAYDFLNSFMPEARR